MEHRPWPYFYLTHEHSQQCLFSPLAVFAKYSFAVQSALSLEFPSPDSLTMYILSVFWTKLEGNRLHNVII